MAVVLVRSISHSPGNKTQQPHGMAWIWEDLDGTSHIGGANLGSSDRAELYAILDILRSYPTDEYLSIIVSNPQSLMCNKKLLETWSENCWHDGRNHTIKYQIVYKAIYEELCSRTGFVDFSIDKEHQNLHSISNLKEQLQSYALEHVDSNNPGDLQIECWMDLLQDKHYTDEIIVPQRILDCISKELIAPETLVANGFMMLHSPIAEQHARVQQVPFVGMLNVAGATFKLQGHTDGTGAIHINTTELETISNTDRE